MSKTKPKKEKVIYIDDGRTIADMSGVSSNRDWFKKGTTSSFKDIWCTYFSAVRMMIKPMLVVLGFIAAACLTVTLLYLLSKI